MCYGVYPSLSVLGQKLPLEQQSYFGFCFSLYQLKVLTALLLNFWNGKDVLVKISLELGNLFALDGVLYELTFV